MGGLPGWSDRPFFFFFPFRLENWKTGPDPAKPPVVTFSSMKSACSEGKEIRQASSSPPGGVPRLVSAQPRSLAASPATCRPWKRAMAARWPSAIARPSAGDVVRRRSAASSRFQQSGRCRGHQRPPSPGGRRRCAGGRGSSPGRRVDWRWTWAPPTLPTAPLIRGRRSRRETPASRRWRIHARRGPEDHGVRVGQGVRVGHGHVGERLLGLDGVHLLQHRVGKRLGNLREHDLRVRDLAPAATASASW